MNGAQIKISLKDVSKSFGDRLAIDNVSFSIATGQTATVIGPTGCGKTSILNMVAGFTAPSSGQLLIDGLQVNSPGPDRGFMFQRPTLLPWLKVFANVEFPIRYGQLPGKQHTASERAQLVDHYLEKVGLHDARNLYPHEMSGGMQSRAALARLLIAESSVLLMDEPFAALDAQTRFSMQQLLKRVVRSEGLRTVLFITHDVEEALLISDHIFLMSASPGRIVRHVEVPFREQKDYRDIVLRPEFISLKHELIDQLEKLVPD